MKTQRNAVGLMLLAMLFALSSCAVQLVQVDPGGEVTKEEHQRLGGIYESKGDYDLAAREYSSAVSLDKNDAGLYFAVGNVYAKMLRYKDARINYQNSVNIDPKNAFAYNNLGWAFMEEGEFVKAEEAVNAALGMDKPNRHIYLDTLAEIKLRSSDTNGAEAILLEAAAGVKDDKTALKRIYTHLVALYNKTGKTKKAAEIVKKIKGL